MALLKGKTCRARWQYLSREVAFWEVNWWDASSTRDAAMPSFETSSASLAISGASRPATTRPRKNRRQGKIRPARILLAFLIFRPIQP